MKFINFKRRYHPLELGAIMFITYFIFSNPLFLTMGAMFISWSVLFAIFDVIGFLFSYAFNKFKNRKKDKVKDDSTKGVKV